jgi:RNA polymerase sigma-70 factor (ECF subfamily)
VASPDAQNLSDLIARSALKDQRAFKQLYDATSAKLYPVALRILRRQQLAEDVLQKPS